MPPRDGHQLRPSRRRRVTASSSLRVALASADTSWLIAGEKDRRKAMAHLKALSDAGQVLTGTPGVIVEAMRRCNNLPAMQHLVSLLQPQDTTLADGIRAAELLHLAGKYTGTPHKTIHQISAVDALVAAVAERLNGTIYTQDPTDMELLRNAGAMIDPVRVPF